MRRGAAAPARRRRGRRARVLAATLVVVATTVGCSAPGTGSQGGAARTAGPGLPREVNAPGTWSAVAPVAGPVAAVGVALRTRPVGVRGRSQELSLFTTSARDGRSTWTTLPGSSLEDWGLVGGVAVSPDGRTIGWVRPRRAGGDATGSRVSGWSVMDTVSGRVRRLDAPGGSAGATASDLAFSGDSRYLLTSFEPPRRPGDARLRGHHAFVAWDVRDGSRTVLEQPGHYFLPVVGSAPSGVVWSRGREVHREDPTTGARTTVTLPHPVVTATWAPHGAAFAYIGTTTSRASSSWRLYAGRTLAEARDHPIRLRGSREPGQLLGWRDSTHVVVGSYRSTVRVVDVVAGREQDLDVVGSGDQLTLPLLAAGLWARPLVTPVAPTGTTDPRAPARWVAGGVAAAGLTVLLVRRRRRRDRP